MKKEKLLSYENMKLKNQLIFSITVSKEVCGRQCPGCYALKPQLRFPKVLQYRERMLERSKQDSFAQEIIDEIQQFKKPIEAVRLHSAGEFYSQEYIDKWFTVAKHLPKQKFYAFTKRKKDFDFSKLEALPNFVVIDSLKFGGFNYGPYDDMVKLKVQHGTMICPATFKDASKDTCGVSCSWCWTKKAQQFGTVFIKH